MVVWINQSEVLRRILQRRGIISSKSMCDQTLEYVEHRPCSSKEKEIRAHIFQEIANDDELFRSLQQELRKQRSSHRLVGRPNTEDGGPAITSRNKNSQQNTPTANSLRPPCGTNIASQQVLLNPAFVRKMGQAVLDRNNEAMNQSAALSQVERRPERSSPETLASSAPGRRGNLGHEYKVLNRPPCRRSLPRISSFVKQNFQPQQKYPRQGWAELPGTAYKKLASPEACGDKDSLTAPNLSSIREHNVDLMLLEPFPSPTRRKFSV
jgi:hypothetical protein